MKFATSFALLASSASAFNVFNKKAATKAPAKPVSDRRRYGNLFLVRVLSKRIF